jgi:hypothetical protein
MRPKLTAEWYGACYVACYVTFSWSRPAALKEQLKQQILPRELQQWQFPSKKPGAVGGASTKKAAAASVRRRPQPGAAEMSVAEQVRATGLKELLDIFQAGWVSKAAVKALLRNKSLFFATHKNEELRELVLSQLILPALECLCTYDEDNLADGRLHPDLVEVWGADQAGAPDIQNVFQYWTAIVQKCEADPSYRRPLTRWGQALAEQGMAVPTGIVLVTQLAVSSIDHMCITNAPDDVMRAVGGVVRAHIDVEQPTVKALVGQACEAARDWFRDEMAAGVLWSTFAQLVAVEEHLVDDIHLPIVSAAIGEAVQHCDLDRFEDWMSSTPTFWLGFVAWASTLSIEAPEHKTNGGGGGGGGYANGIPLRSASQDYGFQLPPRSGSAGSGSGGGPGPDSDGDEAGEYGGFGGDEAPEARIATMRDQLKHNLDAMFDKLKSGNYLPTDLEFILHGGQEQYPLLIGAFRAAGHADGDAVLSTQRRLVQQMKAMVHTTEQVCERYFTGSGYHQSAAAINADWLNTPMVQVGHFLLEHDHFVAPASGVGAQNDLHHPLTATLHAAVPWLQRLADSKLFSDRWGLPVTDFGPDGIDSRIRATQVKWKALCDKFLEKTILFNELDEILEMLNRTELEMMGETNPGRITGKPYPPFSIARGEHVQQCNEWAEEMGLMFAEYKKFKTLHTDLPLIVQSLEFLGPWMTAAGNSEASTLAMRLDHLHARLGDKWSTTSLLSVGHHLKELRDKQSDLTAMSGLFADTTFIKILASCVELLDWLRMEFALEQNFVSAVERVSNSEKALLGPRLRANLDGALSDLARVRQTLFEFIYRDRQEFESLQELLAELKKVEGCIGDKGLHEAMVRCETVTLELAEVMSSDTQDLAPKRLQAYLMPERNGRWTIEMPPPDTAPEDPWSMEDCIKMVTLDDGADVSVPFEALLEFQSSLVLAKGGASDLEKEAQIDKWLSQFWRIQDVARTVYDLQDSGHFQFARVKLTFTLSETPASMLSQRLDLSGQLAAWTKSIQAAREEFYFLTFLTTKQITRLATHLEANDEEKLITSMQIVNSNVKRATIRQASAGMPRLGRDADVVEKLNQCGFWLSQVFSELPVPNRAVPQDLCQSAQNLVILSSSVNMAVVKEIDDVILTAYTSQGHFPEWQELLICSKSTSWEEVQCLLLRWRAATANGRGHRLYCLASAHELADFVQRQASSFILRAERAAKEPLARLLVVNCTDQAALCTDLNHRRLRSYHPPDVSSDVAGKFTLQLVCAELAKEYIGKVHVFSGPRPGCGKTFRINVEANGGADVWSVVVKRLVRTCVF